jgi:uncharacterized membrane protein YphA (DoxX/SURF4 family)
MSISPKLRSKNIGYWVSTLSAALTLGTTGIATLFRVPTTMASLTHLGYPTYFATILGTWELLGAVAILAPVWPRVKEWAYAGMFFMLTGAALSHAASGDPAGKILMPLTVVPAVIMSWKSWAARLA